MDFITGGGVQAAGATSLLSNYYPKDTAVWNRGTDATVSPEDVTTPTDDNQVLYVPVFRRRRR